jgi:hypothetical protein
MAFASRWQVVIGAAQRRNFGWTAAPKFPISGFSRLSIRLDKYAATAPLQKVPEFLSLRKIKQRAKVSLRRGIMIDLRCPLLFRRSQAPAGIFDTRMLFESRDYLIKLARIGGGPHQCCDKLRLALCSPPPRCRYWRSAPIRPPRSNAANRLPANRGNRRQQRSAGKP